MRIEGHKMRPGQSRDAVCFNDGIHKIESDDEQVIPVDSTFGDYGM
jgi:hypothetical protein